MDDVSIAFLGIAGLFALIFSQVPLSIAMAITGVTVFGLMVGFDTAFSIVGVEISSAFGSSELVLIPFFILIGNFAAEAGLSDSIYRISRAFLGHFKGGLSMATVATCAGFGAISGSSLATTALMTRVALPQMLRYNYSRELATGTIAGGGTLGILIPPSIIMVLYAFLTEQSVLAMFVAAIIPGIVTVALYLVAIRVFISLNPDAGPAAEASTWRERGRETLEGWRVIALAVTVSGGIYAGVYSVNEAAGVGTMLTAIFYFLSKEAGGRKFEGAKRVLVSSAATTGLILLLVIGANMMTYFVSVSELPLFIVDWLLDLNLPAIGIIIALLFIYLFLGSVFDAIASMVITLPIVLPLVTELGYDPIWWGIVMVMIIEIGLITPPVGMNIFILHASAPDIPMRSIFKGITPFFVADMIRLILLVAFPALALWLPRQLGL